MEYFLVVFEFFVTSRKSSFLWNIIISVVLGIAIYFFSCKDSFVTLAQSVLSSSASVLSLLVGFSISVFTLLNTTSNPNVEAIKQEKTGKLLYNKPVYLFEELMLSLIYIIITESVLLISNLFFPFFFPLTTTFGKIIFCINASILIHVVFINVGTIVNFYFVITKKR
ncbi:hypothetical protein [Mucilaginibacter sp.]|uniref:hypothetical protein n=1 Tax=Mucilaginibacter sp. TaxID=1882438 RepID=UPI003D0AD9F6